MGGTNRTIPDVHSKEIRTKNMRAIRSTRTSSEDLLAKLIWRAGYRYRRNDKHVFGKPDLAFHKHRVVVFYDGEFWHGKDWAKKKRKISQNQAYWIPKIERNMQWDRWVDKTLLEQGWQVLRFWHQEIKKDLAGCAGKVLAYLKSWAKMKSLFSKLCQG